MTGTDKLKKGSTPPATDGLCCPSCRGPLTWSGPGGHCPDCARAVRVHGDAFLDFLPQWTPAASAILGWPDGFLDRAGGWLEALRSGQPAPPGAADELAARGLADERGALTEAGRTVAYHLAESRRQSGSDGIESFCEAAGLGPGTRVLDVGCGAGQTLRALGDRGPAERTGLDINPEALALGTRLLGPSDRGVRFVRATADALPFRDATFTHVVCRVALNYMPQRPALGEMVRVLRPGGFLYCRVEGPGFDLMLLRQRRGGNRRALGHLRNLAWGCALSATGWQPSPRGRLLAWDRAFATSRRLRKTLRPRCDLVRADVTGRYLGLPLGVELVATKRSDDRVGACRLGGGF
jgi:SAM-dependent methyltransferase